MRRRYSAKQWSDWVREQEASELTESQFCLQRGISPKTFYRWHRKLNASADEKDTVATPAFVPESVTPSSSVEVELPGGACLRIPNDEASLRTIVGILFEMGAERR